MTDYIQVRKGDLLQLAELQVTLENEVKKLITAAKEAKTLHQLLEVTWNERVDQIVDMLIDNPTSTDAPGLVAALKVLRP